MCLRLHNQPAQPGVSIPHPLHPHLPARHHTHTISVADRWIARQTPLLQPGYTARHTAPRPSRAFPAMLLARSTTLSREPAPSPCYTIPPPSPNQSPGSIQEISPGSWLLQARFLIRIPRHLSPPLLLPLPLRHSPQSCSLGSVVITMGSAEKRHRGEFSHNIAPAEIPPLHVNKSVELLNVAQRHRHRHHRDKAKSTPPFTHTRPQYNPCLLVLVNP